MSGNDLGWLLSCDIARASFEQLFVQLDGLVKERSCLRMTGSAVSVQQPMRRRDCAKRALSCGPTRIYLATSRSNSRWNTSEGPAGSSPASNSASAVATTRWPAGPRPPKPQLNPAHEVAGSGLSSSDPRSREQFGDELLVRLLNALLIDDGGEDRFTRCRIHVCPTVVQVGFSPRP